MAHSIDSLAPTHGESGNGWVRTEIVLVRSEDSFAPNASFPLWRDGPVIDKAGTISHIGYDAVVCAEMLEPWIVQIYNSSLGVPTTMTIVGKSATADFESDYGNRGPHLDSYSRVLNSTGKDSAYRVGYAGCSSFERC